MAYTTQAHCRAVGVDLMLFAQSCSASKEPARIPAHFVRDQENNLIALRVCAGGNVSLCAARFRFYQIELLILGASKIKTIGSERNGRIWRLRSFHVLH